ncbi:MAG: helix-turn-helix domain-containing protein [Thermoplasmata archaeon]|nr:helix-turn-helix domain-containing protein [Thermoplasmata archaeon]
MGNILVPSIADRVLLHLSKVRIDRGAEKVPNEISQEGIAAAVGISRSHVPRAVKELISAGYIEESKKHVKDGEKRVKVYLITPRGLARAKEIEDTILSQIIPAKIQNTMVQGMTLKQIETAFHRRINIIRLTGQEDFIDLDAMMITGVTDFSDSPKISLFLNREESLEQMKQFLKSRAGMLAIYGAKGIGTSSLAKHFIQMLDNWNILWVSLLKHRSLEDLRNRLESFADLLKIKQEMMIESSAGSNILLMFDGYFDVDEEIVGFFSSLVERRDGAKIIVTCRDSTPSYNRFYRKEHLQSGNVQEMVLKGLCEKDSKILLGNDEIPDEALRRIFAMSRGSPMILTMLRDKDEEGLRRNSTFTNEEIRFLLTESVAKKQT